MNWTQNKPTQEGWYWFRMDNEEKRTVIVYVISADRMVAVGSEREGNPALQKGSWLGPLEPPRFEETKFQT
jgi:hypothetical protein